MFLGSSPQPVAPAGVRREIWVWKKLGVIGGTSWTSTALYYYQLNRLVRQHLGGLHSAKLAIESLDLAPFVAMQQSGDWAGSAELPRYRAPKH